MNNKLKKSTILVSSLSLFLSSFIVINAYNGEDEIIKGEVEVHKKEIGTKLNVEATAYTGDTITSTGTTPKWGTIAVDPDVIPYGTRLYIPCFDKVFVAEDCGSAIKGNKIDIFMNNSENMDKWGRRNIEVYILDENVQI